MVGVVWTPGGSAVTMRADLMMDSPQVYAYAVIAQDSLDVLRVGGE
jgi:hypothetical protein